MAEFQVMVRYPIDQPVSRAAPEADGRFTDSLLLSLYRSMLRIRMVELEIEKRYPEDEMKCPIHLVIGQESTVAGACHALRLTDLAFASHRTHGVYLAKGGNLQKMIAELYCRETGCTASRGGAMHLVDHKAGLPAASAIVGGIVPIAAGSALASQIKGDDQVSAVFFGDAATEEGVVSETLNFAALKKLPLVFFCENNFYSVCSPLSQRQPITELHRRAAAFGVQALRVDGTRVLDVYEATQEAVSRARRGDGPTFIEATIYRWRAHVGTGDDSQKGYRDLEELKQWQDACPIALHRNLLLSRRIWSEKQERLLVSELEAEIQGAFEFAGSSAHPNASDLEGGSYAVD